MFLLQTKTSKEFVCTVNTQYCKTYLGMILPVDAVKNALLLGLDIALIRASHYNEDIQKYVNNAIVNRMEICNEIKELAELCNKTAENVMIVLCSGF